MTSNRSTVRCQKCGHTGVPSPTVVLDLEAEIRDLKAELDELREQLRGKGELLPPAAPDQSVGVHPAGTETGGEAK